MTKVRLQFMGLVFGSLIATQSLAVPVFYTNDEAGFQAAVGGNTLTVDSYETPFTNASSVTFSDYSVTAPDSETILSYETTLAAADGDMTLAIIDYGFNGNQLVFNFDTAINAFAIDVFGALDFGGGGTLSLSTNTGAAGACMTGLHTLGEYNFCGLIDDALAFTTLTITSTLSGDGIQFDRLQYGAFDSGGGGSTSVPEPESLFLMAIGLLGMGVRLSRKAA